MGVLLKHTTLKKLGNSYAILITKKELESIKVPAKVGQLIWAVISDKQLRV